MGLLSRFLRGGKASWSPVEFWTWFQSADGQTALATVARSESAQRSIRDAICRVNSGLVWGARLSSDGSKSTFEVSAGGIKALIPAVRGLVDAAPVIAGWDVVAFKQPSA